MISHAGSLALAAALLFSAPCAGQVIAFHGVTVIPMTGQAGLTGHTVLVRDGLIQAVGPDSSVRVPPGAVLVDGSGKYLIPGLIEMHAHTSTTRASAFGLYVVHGVTTIRDAGSEHSELLRWRNEIRSGIRVGPRIRIAGPYLESQSNVDRMRRDPPGSRIEPFERARIGVGSPEQARHVVDSLARLDLDFLKVRTIEDRPTYAALNAAADSHGLRLTGHAIFRNLHELVDAGQDLVDHTFYQVLDSVTPAGRDSIWRRFAARGIGVVPTLVTITDGVHPGPSHLRALVDDTAGILHPMRRYISRFLTLDWKEQAEEATDARQRFFLDAWPSSLRDVGEMHRAGVRVMAGTDVAVINVFPGWSLHDELRLFVEAAGFTPFEALLAEVAVMPDLRVNDWVP